MAEILKAPWTEEQVENLYNRQCCTHTHEYTCNCGEPLIPTTDGWVCKHCNYTQHWCFKTDA